MDGSHHIFSAWQAAGVSACLAHSIADGSLAVTGNTKEPGRCWEGEEFVGWDELGILIELVLSNVFFKWFQAIIIQNYWGQSAQSWKPWPALYLATWAYVQSQLEQLFGTGLIQTALREKDFPLETCSTAPVRSLWPMCPMCFGLSRMYVTQCGLLLGDDTSNESLDLPCGTLVPQTYIPCSTSWPVIWSLPTNSASCQNLARLTNCTHQLITAIPFSSHFHPTSILHILHIHPR